MNSKPWHNFSYDEDYSLNQLAKIYAGLVKRAQIALVQQGSLNITDKDLEILRNLSHEDVPDNSNEVAFWYRQKIHNLIVILSRLYNGPDGIKLYSLTNAAMVKLSGISRRARTIRVDSAPVVKRTEFLIRDIFGFDVNLILRFNTNKLSINLIYSSDLPLTLSQVEEENSICLPTDNPEVEVNNEDVIALIRKMFFEDNNYQLGDIISTRKGKMSINGKNIPTKTHFSYESEYTKCRRYHKKKRHNKH